MKLVLQYETRIKINIKLKKSGSFGSLFFMIIVLTIILAISFLLWYKNSVMSQLKAFQMKQHAFQDV